MTCNRRSADSRTGVAVDTTAKDGADSKDGNPYLPTCRWG